jgi:hypothetical protein
MVSVDELKNSLDPILAVMLLVVTFKIALVFHPLEDPVSFK